MMAAQSLGFDPQHHLNPGEVVPALHPSTGEMEVGGPRVQFHLGLHNGREASLAYRRPCHIIHN